MEIYQVNPTSLEYNKFSNNQEITTEEPIDEAQEAINKTPVSSDKKLCCLIRILKMIFDKIFRIFCCCFNKKPNTENQNIENQNTEKNKNLTNLEKNQNEVGETKEDNISEDETEESKKENTPQEDTTVLTVPLNPNLNTQNNQEDKEPIRPLTDTQDIVYSSSTRSSIVELPSSRIHLSETHSDPLLSSSPESSSSEEEIIQDKETQKASDLNLNTINLSSSVGTSKTTDPVSSTIPTKDNKIGPQPQPSNAQKAKNFVTNIFNKIINKK
jgi:hypothetical protein